MQMLCLLEQKLVQQVCSEDPPPTQSFLRWHFANFIQFSAKWPPKWPSKWPSIRPAKSHFLSQLYPRRYPRRYPRPILKQFRPQICISGAEMRPISKFFGTTSQFWRSGGIFAITTTYIQLHTWQILKQCTRTLLRLTPSSAKFSSYTKRNAKLHKWMGWMAQVASIFQAVQLAAKPLMKMRVGLEPHDGLNTTSNRRRRFSKHWQTLNLPNVYWLL